MLLKCFCMYFWNTFVCILEQLAQFLKYFFLVLLTKGRRSRVANHWGADLVSTASFKLHSLFQTSQPVYESSSDLKDQNVLLLTLSLSPETSVPSSACCLPHGYWFLSISHWILILAFRVACRTVFFLKFCRIFQHFYRDIQFINLDHAYIHVCCNNFLFCFALFVDMTFFLWFRQTAARTILKLCRNLPVLSLRTLWFSLVHRRPFLILRSIVLAFRPLPVVLFSDNSNRTKFKFCSIFQHFVRQSWPCNIHAAGLEIVSRAVPCHIKQRP